MGVPAASGRMRRSPPQQGRLPLFRAVMAASQSMAAIGVPVEFYVSSGARASELLGLGLEDIDWGGQLIYVVSKGTRARQPVPAFPDAFRYLRLYLAADRLPGSPVWRTRRGEQRTTA
jgi:integrase